MAWYLVKYRDNLAFLTLLWTSRCKVRCGDPVNQCTHFLTSGYWNGSLELRCVIAHGTRHISLDEGGAGPCRHGFPVPDISVVQTFRSQ